MLQSPSRCLLHALDGAAKGFCFFFRYFLAGDDSIDSIAQLVRVGFRCFMAVINPAMITYDEIWIEHEGFRRKLGAVLVGMALGLTAGSAVSGLPGGWGGALGLGGANGIAYGIEQIGDPGIEGPVKLALILLGVWLLLGRTLWRS